MPREHDWLFHFRLDPKPLKVLILEYLPNALRMTLRHTNLRTVPNAMTSLKKIQERGIRHCNIHPRNILVLPGDRVVFVDFELAGVKPGTEESYYRLELGVLYSWLYQHLVCGFRNSRVPSMGLQIVC
ncbi:hypothetical protein K439DRAFT_26347 [Ramaria rubella]|nr:hypothetical protein K439DRAFT_26347 [Ramaria rubella]